MAQTKLLLTLKKYVDGHIERLHSLIDALELKHGRDGKNGLDGKDGKDGLNGLNGLDGVDGKDGKDGKQGKDGKNGKDGVSVVDAKIDIDNHLVITLSDNNEIDAGSLEALAKLAEPSVYRTNTRVVQAALTWTDYIHNWAVEPETVRAGAIAEYGAAEYNKDEFTFGNKNFEYGTSEFNASEYSGSISGSIMKYTYTNGVLYRFVPEPYVPIYDAFYKDVGLTEKVASRGGSI
jgi:hypothetical protein